MTMRLTSPLHGTITASVVCGAVVWRLATSRHAGCEGGGVTTDHTGDEHRTSCCIMFCASSIIRLLLSAIGVAIDWLFPALRLCNCDCDCNGMLIMHALCLIWCSRWAGLDRALNLPPHLPLVCVSIHYMVVFGFMTLLYLYQECISGIKSLTKREPHINELLWFHWCYWFFGDRGWWDAMSYLPVKLPGRFLIDLEMSSYIVQIYICMYTVQTVGSGHSCKMEINAEK